MPYKCTVELDKNDGIKVTLDDANGPVQLVVLDGKSIRLTLLEDGKPKSSVELKPDGVRIQCATFEVSAEQVNITATKDIAIDATKGNVELGATKGKVTLNGASVETQAKARSSP